MFRIPLNEDIYEVLVVERYLAYDIDIYICYMYFLSIKHICFFSERQQHRASIEPYFDVESGFVYRYCVWRYIILIRFPKSIWTYANVGTWRTTYRVDLHLSSSLINKTRNQKQYFCFFWLTYFHCVAERWSWWRNCVSLRTGQQWQTNFDRLS